MSGHRSFSSGNCKLCDCSTDDAGAPRHALLAVLPCGSAGGACSFAVLCSQSNASGGDAWRGGMPSNGELPLSHCRGTLQVVESWQRLEAQTPCAVALWLNARRRAFISHWRRCEIAAAAAPPAATAAVAVPDEARGHFAADALEQLLADRAPTASARRSMHSARARAGEAARPVTAHSDAASTQAAASARSVASPTPRLFSGRAKGQQELVECVVDVGAAAATARHMQESEAAPLRLRFGGLTMSAADRFTTMALARHSFFLGTPPVPCTSVLT